MKGDVTAKGARVVCFVLTCLASSFGPWVGFGAEVKAQSRPRDGGSLPAIVRGPEADPSNVWWDNQFGAAGAGVNSTVSALAFDATGNLYAGGRFTTAGGVSAKYIAKWDGTSWAALGTGMNDDVEALTCDSAGNLYAGGFFTTAGGVSVNRIAKWDGTSWADLSGGVNQLVFALTFDSATNLYAGGLFYTAGGGSAGGLHSEVGWDKLVGSGKRNEQLGRCLDV